MLYSDLLLKKVVKYFKSIVLNFRLSLGKNIQISLANSKQTTFRLY